MSLTTHQSTRFILAFTIIFPPATNVHVSVHPVVNESNNERTRESPAAVADNTRVARASVARCLSASVSSVVAADETH